MSITLGDLKNEVSDALRDPEGATFDTTAVGNLINMGIAELGRIAPAQFREELTLVENQMEYTLLSDDFGGEAVPEVEVTRVEVWDASQVPPALKMVVNPAALEADSNSDNGWTLWGGVLYLPSRFHRAVNGHEADYTVRVYGYSPYPQVSDDTDVISVSSAIEWAIVSFCAVEAMQRLHADRALFTQWQTRSGNTDISPAGLLSALNAAREDWRRKSRALLRLRSRA